MLGSLERQKAQDKQINILRRVPRLHPAVVENRLGEGRRLLRQSTTQGRYSAPCTAG
jgi:hypothetical protein